MVRFWTKVKIRGPDQCWLWVANKNAQRRGLFEIDGRTWTAPRVAWMLLFADPGEAYVLHSCDNPQCVNPKHLFLGNQKANMEDRNHKSRQARGEKHPRARLTEVDVRAIRAAAFHGPSLLARQYGVHKNTISSIIHGVNWAWLR